LTDQIELEDHGGSIAEDNKKDHGPCVGDNISILDDDVDENMLENDIDDDDDIINPFNIVSELDDHTNVDFDEEDQDKE
jgi:hypothetical protein